MWISGFSGVGFLGRSRVLILLGCGKGFERDRKNILPEVVNVSCLIRFRGFVSSDRVCSMWGGLVRDY